MEELKLFNLDNALKRCKILNGIVNGETVIQPAPMTNAERFRANNIVTNLEWCTSSYNKRYGNGRTSRSEGMKKVWKERRTDDGKAD